MSTDLTQVLTAIEKGDSAAAEQLLPLVYDELRRLASARMAQEAPGQTLQATALVHEAYLRVLGKAPDGQPGPHFDGRGHFFAAAAESMRRILIDRARSRRAERRGGQHQRVDLDLNTLSVDQVPVELLDLDEALRKLAEHDEVKARLVTLRFFGGLTLKEAAAILELPPTTADRYWAYARAWLYRAMKTDAS